VNRPLVVRAKRSGGGSFFAPAAPGPRKLGLSSGRALVPWVLFGCFCLVVSVQSAFVLTVGTATLLTVIIASGLNLSMGYVGLDNLGMGAFYAVGAYGAAKMAVDYQVPTWAIFICAPLLAAICALAVGAVILARTRGFQFAIATLALGIVVYDVALSWNFTGAAFGIPGVPQPSFLSTPSRQFITVAVVCFVVVLVMHLLAHSAFGRKLVAIRDDELLVSAMGSSVLRYKLITFFISALIAGIAGVLYAYVIQYVSPTPFALSGASFEAFAIVAFGGAGTTWGPVIGGILLTGITQFVNVGPETLLLCYGLAIVLVVILVPSGIVPGLRSAAIFVLRAVRGRVAGHPDALKTAKPQATGSGDER
jgi:branched-chain amino acid transport system permease protein